MTSCVLTIILYCKYFVIIFLFLFCFYFVLFFFLFFYECYDCNLVIIIIIKSVDIKKKKSHVFA